MRIQTPMAQGRSVNIISMIQGIRTSSLSIKNSLSLAGGGVERWHHAHYRGTSLIKNSVPPGPYSRNMPRALWRSYEGGLILMSEVTLYELRPLCCGRGHPAWGGVAYELESCVIEEAQGYLAYKKLPPPRTLQ